MSYILEVKYFNTFVAKKVATRGEKVYTVKPTPDWTGTIPQIYEAGPIGGFFGFPWDPTGYPPFPTNIFNLNSNPADNWFMNGLGWSFEESRIKGGYNNDMVGQGVKAYLVDSDAETQRRSSSLIYSGLLNNRTNINKTNVFNVGEDISRTVSPEYGSIQKIHSDDGNLLILQENKSSQALIDKDVIYTAEGGQVTTAGKVVIGPVTPYAGDYGNSKFPESFANHGFRKYYADKNRNAIIRLSRDGITEISEYGMFDWFRDELGDLNQEYRNIDLKYVGAPVWYKADGNLAAVGDVATYFDIEVDTGDQWTTLCPGMLMQDSNGSTYPQICISSLSRIGNNVRIILNSGITVGSAMTTGVGFRAVVKDKVLGSWDSHNKCYTISLKKYYLQKTTWTTSEGGKREFEGLRTSFYTLNFDEKVKGWVSFFTYNPDQIFSVKNKFYSTSVIQETIDGEKPDDPKTYGTFGLFKHYSDSSKRGEFYKVTSDSNITSILNANPHTVKNFKTINYEGSNGWEVSMMYSSTTGVDSKVLSYDPLLPANISSFDLAGSVKSYYEGGFTIDQSTDPPTVVEYPSTLPINTQILRSGFDRKENKYFSNLKNNSGPKPGEVVFGNNSSGIKGFYSIVTLKTDSSTNYGGAKELFSIGSEIVISSN